MSALRTRPAPRQTLQTRASDSAQSIAADHADRQVFVRGLTGFAPGGRSHREWLRAYDEKLAMLRRRH